MVPTHLLSVSKVRRDDEPALSADFHPDDTLIPTGDDTPHSQLETRNSPTCRTACPSTRASSGRTASRYVRDRDGAPSGRRCAGPFSKIGG